ncbi:MAG: response regulator [Oligoflexia bacterium]|nr:response regulator [Oligoflexia bacterium]
MKKTMVGIDDSNVNREIFKEAANKLGMDVVIGNDGIDGFEKIISSIEKKKIPDIIITDINMPRMNGIDLIAKLKGNSSTKYIPILVLTTEKDDETKTKCKELGAAGWIKKPLSPEEITIVIKKFMKI